MCSETLKYFTLISFTLILTLASDTMNTLDHTCPFENTFKNESTSNVTLPPNLNFVIELAIICDKDFGDLFSQNRTKILNYWKAFMWDANNRLKTLKTANISIHVTQLVLMSNRTQQPFIENSRENTTMLVNLKKFLHEFASWTYEQVHAKQLAGFDIALGITGSSLAGNQSGFSFKSGMCNVNKFHKKNFGVLVLSDFGDFRVGTVCHELGHLLGAGHDFDLKDNQCQNYLMDYSDCRGPLEQFAFSKCSDEAIGKFVFQGNSSCIKRKNFEGDILYDANVKLVNPPSIKEQCERWTKNKLAFVAGTKSTDELCQRVKCMIKVGNNTNELEYTPVDSSKCKDNGFCFRGKCINIT